MPHVFLIEPSCVQRQCDSPQYPMALEPRKCVLHAFCPAPYLEKKEAALAKNWSSPQSQVLENRSLLPVSYGHPQREAKVLLVQVPSTAVPSAVAG